ncbi:hypothetical protein HER14_16785 [Acidithiobacillus thiooxidans]|uniref:hypothetical protein n=1 Tax=Acidithiobacillus thiooxidans TaxID=930 RepID=UPI001C07296D|nr:hypothetical protein [Acidithiobacillus thiooxidans]MBU2752530.1 hypothetical protein [Acidithiobacillus thiooxidans]
MNNRPSSLLFFGVGLALATSAFIAVAIQNIFPYLAGSLTTSDHHAVWVLTFMVMNWAVGSTLMPWVSARIGIRGAFNGSVLALIVSSAICASTSNIWSCCYFVVCKASARGYWFPSAKPFSFATVRLTAGR